MSKNKFSQYCSGTTCLGINCFEMLTRKQILRRKKCSLGLFTPSTNFKLFIDIGSKCNKIPNLFWIHNKFRLKSTPHWTPVQKHCTRGRQNTRLFGYPGDNANAIVLNSLLQPMGKAPTPLKSWMGFYKK